MAPETFETVDGSTPEITPLAAEHGRRLPLSAFTLLSGGDVFETVNGRPPPDGAALADSSPAVGPTWSSPSAAFVSIGRPAHLGRRLKN